HAGEVPQGVGVGRDRAGNTRQHKAVGRGGQERQRGRGRRFPDRDVLWQTVEKEREQIGFGLEQVEETTFVGAVADGEVLSGMALALGGSQRYGVAESLFGRRVEGSGGRELYGSGLCNGSAGGRANDPSRREPGRGEGGAIILGHFTRLALYLRNLL